MIVPLLPKLRILVQLNTPARQSLPLIFCPGVSARNRQFKTHAHLFADADDDPTNLKMATAVVGLVVITLLVALLSEFLVDAIDGFTEQVRTETRPRALPYDSMVVCVSASRFVCRACGLLLFV